MTTWTNPEDAGFLPQIFIEDDPRSAQEQANTNYAHGGGWFSFMGRGFHLQGNPADGFSLKYPGDPPLRELSRTNFHNQLLVLFSSSWVGLINRNSELLDVARMD